MKTMISEIKAEKDAKDQAEKEYIYNQKPITHFPYTHGDTLEESR